MVSRYWSGGLALLIAIFASTARSEEWVDNFSSAANWDATASSVVVNLALTRAHPSIANIGYNNGAGATDKAFNIGDGRHGPFNSTTYTQFGTYAGNVITIDTDTYPELHFTSFTLDAGDTLRGTGSQPLIIHVQANMTINGTIDCSGGAGGSIADGDTASTAAGGTARCGGGAGAAGATAGAGGNGTSGGAGVTGGTGGVAGFGGGGGGSYTLTAGGYRAEPGAGGGGNRGTSTPDHAFLTIGGGSGGGGGGDGTTSNGAGGGGGGGVILIYAGQDITIGAAGIVKADGGAGGVVTGAANAAAGGAGGGGGGGSVLIFAGRTLNVLGAAGPPYRVTASYGTAGATSGLAGGRGAYGRTWLVDGDDAGAEGLPGGASVDDPQSLLTAIGKNNFSLVPEYLVSKTIDLQSTKPALVSANLTAALAGAATATLEIKGSSDGFVSSDTGWKSSGSLSEVSGLRYVKFRITLDSDGIQNYSYITQVKLTYIPFDEKDFVLVGACGSVHGASPWTLALWILPLLIFGITIRNRSVRAPESASPQES